MEAKNVFKNPYLSSWNKELFQKIKDKRTETDKMSGEIQKLGDLKTYKESELLSLENVMGNTLTNVEKSIEKYSSSVQSKLEKLQNASFEKTSEKSKALFSLYKELYQDARIFFSRNEFKYEPSSLKVEINDRILSWLSYLFDDENSNNWTDILIPIWSLEYQYHDMESKQKGLIKEFEKVTKNYNDKKKVYNELTEEIEKMKKELDALKEFSDKITNYRKEKSEKI